MGRSVNSQIYSKQWKVQLEFHDHVHSPEGLNAHYTLLDIHILYLCNDLNVRKLNELESTKYLGNPVLSDTHSF